MSHTNAAATITKMILVFNMWVSLSVPGWRLYLRITRNQQLFFSELFYLFAVLDLIDKNLGRFKAGNVVFFDNDGGVA